MNEFNTKIRAEIRQLLEKDEKVLTAWEGGSLATGYFDEYTTVILLTLLLYIIHSSTVLSIAS